MSGQIIRLLLVEDNSTDVLLLKEKIAEAGTPTFEITHADRLSQALEKLEEEQFDVVVCDLSLPDSQGLETFRQLHAAYPATPVLVVTSLYDEEIGLKAIAQGAQDYLIKEQMGGHSLDRIIRHSIERKQTAATLFESQYLLESTLNALSSHIAVLDEDGTIIAVNQAWEHFAQEHDGSACTCGVGANYLDACAQAEGDWSEKAAEAARGIREVIAGERSVFHQEDSCHNATEQCWFNLRVTPFNSVAPKRVVVAHENITERKLAKATLQQSEARFRTAITEAPIPIMIHREDGKVLQISKGWTEYSGYDIEDIPTIHDWIERACGDQSTQVNEYIKTIYQIKQTSSNREWTIKAKNGEERIWEFVSTPLGDFGDGQRVIISTAFDITERKQAEAAQIEREHEFKALVENAPDIISRYDRKFRHLYVNRAVTDVTGLPASAFIGKTHEEAGMPRHLQVEWRAILQDVFDSGEERETEYEFLTPGGPRFYHSRLVPEYASDGRIQSVLNIARDITERKQAGEELRESEARLRALVESLDEIVFEFDILGNYVNIWTSEESLLAQPKADLLGRSVEDVLGTAIGRPFVEAFQRVIASGQAESIEYALDVTEGKRSFLAYLSPIVAADGSCMTLCMLSRDITERKQIEEELRASEERFQSILANVPGMVYQIVKHPDGTIEWPFVSEGCRELLGMEAETVQGHPNWLLETTHPDDRLSFDLSVTISAETLTPRIWEGRRELPSGGFQWLQSISRPQRLADGSTLWDGVLLDVTARKEAEVERDRFFSLSLDMMGIAGADGYFKRLNPAFEETLGFSNAELMAVPFLEFVHPDDRAATLAEMANLHAGETVIQFENRYRCRDGSYRWVQWMTAPFENLWYFAARDITEIKNAKTNLQQANDQLEERVVVRTAELKESMQKMRAAQQDAEAANKAKSEFLSRMSHELRTPLNAILGFGQILEKQELSPIGIESVGYILSGGRHLLGLINEVLDISRVEAGHLEVSIGPIELNAIVRAVCALMGPLAAERNLRLNENVSSICHHRVMADNQRLQQVLINLLSNAIKYNREGGEVEVSCAPMSDNRLAIKVRDSGPGIAPEDLPKVFTPFERLGADVSQIEGTGLGLPLAQKLVSAMGGKLSVESVLGSGTTFTVEMSLAPQEAELAESPMTYSDPPEERSFTVLCIEDNPSNLRLMEAIFEDRPDIRLITAIQGSIGLELALQHEPDLILLDLNLPDIHGSEVLSRLQQSAITRDIPVVIVSADAISTQTEKLISAGAKSYLTKPIDVNKLMQTLDEILKESTKESTDAAN